MRRHFKNQKIGIADSKAKREFEGEQRRALDKDKELGLFLGKNYLKSPDKFDIIIKTPGVVLNKQLVERLKKKKIIVSSNLDIFLANIQGKVVGITGSKGKGTAASLIFRVMKVAGKKAYLVGNIGSPFLDYINHDSQKTIYIAELSSFHLEQMKGKLDLGLITSWFPEHLREHGSAESYFRAKMRLVKNLKEGGVVIYNRGYGKVAEYIRKQKVKSIGYSKPKERIETQLLGRHNLENIAGAIEVAKQFRIKKSTYLMAIKSFKGLPYRLEPIGRFRGISFYLDTLGTTPETTAKALEALKEKKLQSLIVGGVSKGGDYKLLAKEIIRSKIRTLVMLPNVGRLIGREIKGIKAKGKPELIAAKNMREAVNKSYKSTRAGEAVVLSPAGSSFDYYKDYADKGDDFRRWVKRLK